MSNIVYKKGNILTLKKYPRILIHSCNTDGAWGGGIAYQLALRYPHAEQDYIDICKGQGSRLLGKCALIPSYGDENLLIACLFTLSFSDSMGDSKRIILENTRKSLDHLHQLLKEPNDQLAIQRSLGEYKLEMPKINSGIFGVPWEQTEAILREFEGKMEFTVYEL